MEDLTLASFAYLRLPLALAVVAFVVGSVGTFKANTQRAVVAGALMMILFFHAARLAMVAFDPYLSSRPLAEAIEEVPPGQLIIDRHYYDFSSVFFYLNRQLPILNGRRLNLEYGAAAPGTPDVFWTPERFRDRWLSAERCYVIAKEDAISYLGGIVGRERLNVVRVSGGKLVMTNQPFPGTTPLRLFSTEAPKS
jgi:hypothetical protein